MKIEEKHRIIIQILKFHFIFILVIISCFDLHATPKNPDKLIYKGRKLELDFHPLYQFFKNASPYPKMFNGEYCGDYSGEVAEWTIIDDILYLTAIYCYEDDDPIKANLFEVFGERCVNGKVKADWVNDSLFASDGKLLFFIDNAIPLYNYELEFQFISGKLMKVIQHDYSKAKESEYSTNWELAKNFIQTNIDWTKIPDPGDQVIKVYVQVSSSDNGKVNDVKIIRSDNALYDQEAIRVINSIPEWHIYYFHGKPFNLGYTIPVEFSNKNKELYLKTK